MKACVIFNGELSNEIHINNYVKQGDIPTSTEFSIYFNIILFTNAASGLTFILELFVRYYSF